MQNKAWLNTDHQLTPGSVIFQSDRWFQLWAYTISHGQLLLRSQARQDLHGRHHDTTIEVMFKPITTVKIRENYDGLVIRRCADQEEAERVRADAPSIRFHDDDRVFALESAGETDYVIAMAVGWHEDILSPTRLSFYAAIDPYEPTWPGTLLGGIDAGFSIASAQDLLDALTDESTTTPQRDQWRAVYVVMKKVTYPKGESETSGAGVFLTRSDAEDFKTLIQPRVADCWIEQLPIAI